MDKAVLSGYVYSEDAIMSDDGDADNSKLGAVLAVVFFSAITPTSALRVTATSTVLPELLDTR